MSADNGIYILQTNSRNSNIREYRVKHLQAVDNVDYDRKTGKDTTDDDIRIENAREMWKGCAIFLSESKALQEANRIEKEFRNNGWFTEYGICFISIDRVF